MKKDIYIFGCILLFISSLLSCGRFLDSYSEKVVHSYTYNHIKDYKWQIKEDSVLSRINIYQTEDIWFQGNIVLESGDTVNIEGFTKAYMYPFTYMNYPDSTYKSGVMEYYEDSVRIIYSELYLPHKTKTYYKMK